MDEMQQPQQPVEQKEAPMAMEKKSGKSWLWTLVIVVILVAAYAGAAYWLEMWPF